MQLTEHGVAILCSAVNPHVSQQLHFALGVLSTGTNAPPLNFRSFCVLKHSLRYDESNPPTRLGYKFLLPLPKHLYVYTNKSVMCTSGLVDCEEPDNIDFGSRGNSILGVGTNENIPIFFTANSGTVSLTPVEFKNNRSMMDQSK